MANTSNKVVRIDYRSERPMPSWMREVIKAHLAIEAEDAKNAGTLGFMARAMVIATMPYKDPKQDVYSRLNGDFKLRILAGYEGGIPYGIYPRFLLSWVATEAVKTQSPVIELGDSLRHFMREVLELRGSSGGSRGTSNRVAEQIKRLFGALITAGFAGTDNIHRFALENVLIADRLRLAPGDVKSFSLEEETHESVTALWKPQHPEAAGAWRSEVTLSRNFFNECIENPVPIDLRAYRALRGSPLAMDIYTWLSYRLFYLKKPSRPIPWFSLMAQFGSGFKSSDADDPTRSVRNFKSGFIQALKAVQVVYPNARVTVEEKGLVLIPSLPHIAPKRGGQSELF